MTTETIHTEPTTPGGRGYWYFDGQGHFYAGLHAADDQPAFLGQFAGGAGCDPTTIRDTDVGVVAWHMSQYHANVTMLTFAATLENARQDWADTSENAQDLARRAADPYEPEPFVEPWWAQEGHPDER